MYEGSDYNWDISPSQIEIIKQILSDNLSNVTLSITYSFERSVNKI